MAELTRVEIEQRMAEVETADAEKMRSAIFDYLGSNLVQASSIGKSYAISDPKQRQQCADWLTDLMDQVYRYSIVMNAEESDDE